MNEMSERDSKETSFEGSSIKRMRLDDGDDSAEETTVSSSSSSSLSYSAALDSEDEDHRSSSARDTSLPFLDLEVRYRNSCFVFFYLLQNSCFFFNSSVLIIIDFLPFFETK